MKFKSVLKGSEGGIRGGEVCSGIMSSWKSSSPWGSSWEGMEDFEVWLNFLLMKFLLKGLGGAKNGSSDRSTP